MNRSDAWLKLKSSFSQQLTSVNEGLLEASILIKQLDLLCIENPAMDNTCVKELEMLIVAENLSENIQNQLLSRINTQKILPDQDKALTVILEKKQSIKQVKKVDNNASLLLKDLSAPDDGAEVKTISQGQIIRGTYSLESKIGEGGMGDVWKAVDLIQDAGESRDKYVAIKFINSEIKSHPDALKALVREFGRYKKLIHPNIVRAYELNRDNNDVYIAMEYLQGIELKQFIKQHPDGVSLEQAKPIIKGMCDALEYAHSEGIVHLDFKPSNVFYNPETKRCKVIDFGIARVTDEEERDKTRFDPGTLGAMTTAYASCEMLMELEPDPRDDIYGLSCVIYELLTGRHPFNKQIAIKAEREKQQIQPILGLGKNALKAMQGGLAFNKEHRTASAKQLYLQLFEPKQKRDNKRTQWIVAASFAAVLLVASPFAVYKGYNSWQLSRVQTAIESQQDSSVTDFTLLTPTEQKELLLNQSLRLSLVQVMSKVAAEETALVSITKFDADIQQILFTDRHVREYLIALYQNKVTQAIKADDFQQAEQHSTHILQYYPDSLQLVALSDSVRLKQESRIRALKYQYQQCVADNSQPLMSLFSCFQETRAKLTNMVGVELLLSSAEAEMAKRYSKSISAAIKSNDLALAKILLSHWHSLEAEKIDSRVKLTAELAYASKVNQFITQISASQADQLADILRELTKQTHDLKQDVVTNKSIKQHLITYYRTMNAQFVTDKKFALAMQHISEGISLFADSKKSVRALKKIQKQISKLKSRYITGLEKSYNKLLEQQEPDVSAIQAVRIDILAVGPNHAIVTMPKLAESYAKKIDRAIANNQFELVKRLVNSWKTLKPSDSKSKIFVALVDKSQAVLQAGKNRKKLTAELLAVMQSNQPEKVLTLISDAKKQLSQQHHTAFLADNKLLLIKFYQQHIDQALEQDQFDVARMIYSEIKSIFPKNKTVLGTGNEILKAKQRRIKQLLHQFGQAMEQPDLEAATIFSPLLRIRAIDDSYIDSSLDMFEKLKSVLIQHLKENNTYIGVQNILTRWDRFIASAAKDKDIKKNQQLLKSTKNSLALRCLIKGKQLKQQKQVAEANAFFMFGLSLSPINTVRERLEEQLI